MGGGSAGCWLEGLIGSAGNLPPVENLECLDIIGSARKLYLVDIALYANVFALQVLIVFAQPPGLCRNPVVSGLSFLINIMVDSENPYSIV